MIKKNLRNNFEKWENNFIENPRNLKNLRVLNQFNLNFNAYNNIVDIS